MRGVTIGIAIGQTLTKIKRRLKKDKNSQASKHHDLIDTISPLPNLSYKERKIIGKSHHLFLSYI